MKLPGFRIFAGLAGAILLVLMLAVCALLGSYVYLEPSLPSPEAMKNVEMQVPLRVYARGGQLIAQIGEQRRVPVAYEEIPELVREAFLAAEDDRFFQHHGIDFGGVLRAVFVNLVTGEAAQGASTITQQTARNMFLSLEKTWRRKLSELFVTLRMEREFSKEQILGLYLNVIFFGQRSYGVAAASEAYFGKPLQQLSVAEIATLAGLPQAPSKYNPVTNPKAAGARRHYVLQRMKKLGYIDADTAQRAEREPITAREHAPLFDVEAPYVAEMVRAEIVARYGEAAINAGYKVYTSIDGRLQTAANRAVRLGLIEYDRRHGYRGALRHVELAAEPTAAAMDALMSDVADTGNLDAAIVTAVGNDSARIYIRGSGPAQIDWDGLSWARRRTAGGGLAAFPKKASDILQRGDIIYVVSNGRGAAQLAQDPEAQGALVALDPDDGAIVALVGGFDYFENKFNRATQARRQPGSGFKPFLYSAALENGLTPASVMMDAPIVTDEKGAEQVWRPENSSGDFGGPMRLREALVRSRNLVSIRVIRQIGVDTAIDYASRFGFDPDVMPHNLTLALGTLPATPLQVATGYATFANGGFKVEPYFIDRVEAPDGKILAQATPKMVCEDCEPVIADPAAATDTQPGAEAQATPAPQAMSALPAAGPVDPDATTNPLIIPEGRRAERIITAANAWLMDDILGDVIKRGTGRRALVLGRSDISGKTGTTNDSRDTWFNGFNRHLTATAWVGFDQERSLGEGEEGSKTAVPIWVHFMREALRGVPDKPRPRPAGLVSARISASSGLLVDGTQAGDTLIETFLADHLPAAAAGTGSATVPNSSAGGGSGESLF
ncbi:MAG: penicillin-binding protein 1A [Steroidobacteraceae bacterium]